VHRDNLCFVNCGEGILETLLKRKGMSGTAVTTAVLYYEMTARNQRKPTDPYTVLRMGPQGDNIGAAISAAGGKWAGTIMQRFQEAEMYCEFGWQRDMKRHMCVPCSLLLLLLLLLLALRYGATPHAAPAPAPAIVAATTRGCYCSCSCYRRCRHARLLLPLLLLLLLLRPPTHSSIPP